MADGEATGEETGPTGLFAVSPWDAVPVALGLGQAAFVVALVLSFSHVGAPLWCVLALVYAGSIAWNIHGVSHNFIHNPFFRSEALNRAYSVLLSLTLGFSHVVCRYIHLRHHIGNSDRPNEAGVTRDLISIYRHGRDGGPEAVWSYSLMTPIRMEHLRLRSEVAAWSKSEGRWATIELACLGVVVAALVIYDWRVVVALLPFWFLGHAFSAMVNYYEHLGADPKKPIAWGVSSYGRLYNWLWLNNGYHAEHHFRTKVHWTGMPALSREIADKRRDGGTKVLAWPHPLGFLG